jgi:hypothetical protein
MTKVWVLPTQDKTLREEEHERAGPKLSYLITQRAKENPITSAIAIHPYRRFSERLNRGHTAGGRPAWEKHRREDDIIDQDPAVQAYYRHCATHRGNNGILSPHTKEYTHSGVKQFLRYAGIELSKHAILDLVNYKRNNPLSTDIERCVQDYAAEPPVKASAGRANCIIGIFKANFARLSVSVNNHFDPEEEDCSTETFLNVWEFLDEEVQDLIQWGVYYPERSSACWKIRFSEFQITGDYAVAWVKAHSDDYQNKTKVKHPAIIPLAFFTKVKGRAEVAGREQPFPNFKSIFKWKVTAFTRQEFKEKFVSNRGRKFFEEMADKAHISPAIAAFLMGDRTKMNQSGHLALIYNTALRQKGIQNIISEYQKVEPYLNLRNRGQPDASSEVEELRQRIRELEGALARKG